MIAVNLSTLEQIIFVQPKVHSRWNLQLACTSFARMCCVPQFCLQSVQDADYHMKSQMRYCSARIWKIYLDISTSIPSSHPPVICSKPKLLVPWETWIRTNGGSSRRKRSKSLLLNHPYEQWQFHLERNAMCRPCLASVGVNDNEKQGFASSGKKCI